MLKTRSLKKWRGRGEGGREGGAPTATATEEEKERNPAGTQLKRIKWRQQLKDPDEWQRVKWFLIGPFTAPAPWDFFLSLFCFISPSPPPPPGFYQRFLHLPGVDQMF